MPVAARRLLVMLAGASTSAVALVGGSAAPADAAQCTQSGVSVVVDFDHGAGGGISTACDVAGGGKYANRIFEEAGFPLTYVNGSGFVCKVKSLPTNADCSQTAPADAYWGLFWSKPGSTSWTYATLGVSSLKIPEGGAVAFAFQDGGTTDPPGVAPARRASSSPKPSPTPTQQVTKTSAGTKPHAAGTGSASVVAPSGTPTTSSSASASSTASPSPSASTSSATPTPTSTASSGGLAAGEPGATVEASAGNPAEGGGLAWWVPVAVLVGLAGGGGAVWWTRRRGSP